MPSKKFIDGFSKNCFFKVTLVPGIIHSVPAHNPLLTALHPGCERSDALHVFSSTVDIR